ncbi:YkvA family protein [Psychrobacter sp. APC 3281]|uniref:YkvA family protein n=1 Tax=Psychrobacter sp. APC 3281 TaxID=3035190 RepID=UPI0025B3851C|nr:YkvA family protein [Psychrobacter sp. APC 3281]MDN3446733.1 YkvA family protein [Psychrobacter sp. APC 3281]
MFNKKTDKNKSLDSNLEYLLGKEDKLKQKLEDSGYLEPFSDDLMLFMSLVKDYYKGDYRKIPFKTISAGVIGALYVLNPIDLIPDSIPFIGHIDDALVLKFCLKQARKDLQKYKEWKQEQSATKDKLEDKNDMDKTGNDKISTDEKDSDETGTNLKKAS